MSGGDGIEIDFNFPGLLETIVGILMILLIIYAIIQICKHHEKGTFRHEEHHGTDSEMLLYSKVSHETHTILNIVSFSACFTVSILSVTVYDPIDKCLNYYLAVLSLSLMAYHTVSHSLQLQQSPLIDNLIFAVGVTVTCFI